MEGHTRLGETFTGLTGIKYYMTECARTFQSDYSLSLDFSINLNDNF